MSRPNSKDAILDAVEQIVAQRGAAHLTLEAVAKQCGISKGGLIYNFPTKECLIQAMLARFMARLEGLRTDARRQLPCVPATNELMVEILATLAQSSRGLRVHAGLLAVIANEPSLLGHLRDQARVRFREVTSCAADPDDAAILFFAAFGLHFHDILEMSLVTKHQRRRLRDRLLGMAGETAPPAGARNGNS